MAIKKLSASEAEKESRRQAVRDRINELSAKLGISQEDTDATLECLGYVVEQAFLGDDGDQIPTVHIATPTLH